MFRKGKSAVEDDPKKGWSWAETEAEPSKRRSGWRLALRDPLRRRRPHICLDCEEDTSTQISAPIEIELLVMLPPQWGSRGRRTKWPDRQHKESS